MSTRWRWTSDATARRRGTGFAIVAAAASIPAAPWLHGLGLSGLVYFTVLALASTTIFFWTVSAGTPNADASASSDLESGAPVSAH